MGIIEMRSCALCDVDLQAELLDAGNIVRFGCPSCGTYFVSVRASEEVKRRSALRPAAIAFVHASESESHIAEFTCKSPGTQHGVPEWDIFQEVVPRTKYDR